MARGVGRLRLLALAAALLAPPAAAGEVGTVPIPVIETGMHGAAINRIDTAAGFLATVSDDKTLRLWEIAGGDLLATLRVPAGPGNEGKLYAVAARPDGSVVAVGGWTGVAWDGGAFIYLIDGRGLKMRGRIGPFAGTVNHLAFSPDGRFLAAAFSDGVGVKVFDLTASRLIAEDRAWRDAVTWTSFDAGGRLAAVGVEGTLRLYDAGFQAVASRVVAARPFSVAFSPDGRQLAVGHLDAARVSLFGGRDLAPAGTLAGAEGRGGALSVVAYGGDGARLFAAGTYGAADGTRFVRRFDGAGANDIPVGRDTVVDLDAHGGGVAFATAEPSWGLVDGAGRRTGGRGKSVADFRDGAEAFRVSADGSVVQFGLEQGGRRPLRFDLVARALAPGAGTGGLAAPLSAGVDVTDWRNGAAPRVDGRPLRLGAGEVARSIAHAGGRRWLLGADHALRLYDGDALSWAVQVPGTVWTVALAPAAGLAVAGLGDGTVRWYDMADGRERLALFVHADGKRWIAWTPDGFFDHAPGGDSLFGYHLNHGRNRLGELIESAQLYRPFFRRDLVVKALRGGHEAEIAAQLAQIGKVEHVLGRGLPPRVAAVEVCPAAGGACTALSAGAGREVEMPGDRAVLKVRLEDRGGGIGPLIVRRNGAVVTGEGLRSTRLPESGDGDRLDEVRIPLEPGDNALTVSATSGDRRVEVNAREQVTARLRAPEAGTELPMLHVLAIGISAYALPELELANARRDAEAVARLMSEGGRGIYRGVAVTTLLDGAASLDGIRAAFQELAAAAKPEDAVLVFLAGHGLALDGRYVFLPADLPAATPEAVRGRGLTQDVLAELFARVPASRMMLMIDTCFAGSIDDRIGRMARDDTWVKSLGRSTGRFTLASTSDEQEALDGFGDNGVFTGVLLEGLRGKADTVASGDNSGAVDVYEIARFTKAQVPAVVRDVAPGHKQEPAFHFEGSDFFPISSVRRDATPR